MGYTLQELMQGLPTERQLAMAVHFVQLGLPIWTEFAVDPAARSYCDGVVGMHHVISETLPARALALAQCVLHNPDHMSTADRLAECAAIKHEFIEPIVALQDGDWELPDAVKLIFYAHSNMVEHLSGYSIFLGGESALYVTVNQAIDALETSGHMHMQALRVALQPFTGGRAPGE